VLIVRIGITAQSPGFATWSFKPLDLGLKFAEGKVPTPLGLIRAKWAIDTATNKLTMMVTAPAGTTGIVAPFRKGEWTVDGLRKPLNGGFLVKGGKEVIIRQV
jgi:hypothetical protein